MKFQLKKMKEKNVFYGSKIRMHEIHQAPVKKVAPFVAMYKEPIECYRKLIESKKCISLVKWIVTFPVGVSVWRMSMCHMRVGARTIVINFMHFAPDSNRL